ncbi:MAG: prepilin-type N-terminal cleavage/methylation domain-containing protein [Planctomycetes bacterium]|nr:prepilin-type N-terminal cleavage/methylation domain-containing protein [Planctomycetota bacterium]
MNQPSPISRSRRHAQRGLSLVEILIALTVFGAFLLATGTTLVGGIAQRRYTFNSYQTISVARNFLADVQEIANMPQDLIADQGVGALYKLYEDRTFTTNVIPNGQITVTIHANETSVPAELGGPQDLNFDGDANDDLDNPAAGTDLVLVPMEVTISFGAGSEQGSITIYRLITNTAE